MYIRSASCISSQPTFRNKGFSSMMHELDEAGIQHPDYAEYIPVMDRRRMTDVQKMSIACSKECLSAAGITQPDSIIVGTAMGCGFHTRNFLDKINESQGGLISPTSFISSTHNTIAGQISILLGNNEYNMTHTQNSLSFEQALTDALLCLGEGKKNILTGGADEDEGQLYKMQERLQFDRGRSSGGAAFFLLSAEVAEDSIRIHDVASYGMINDRGKALRSFLDSNDISFEDIDLLLYSVSDKQDREVINELPIDKRIDYQNYSGIYFTNSGFALNLAFDILSTDSHPVYGDKIKTILIYNNLVPENLGLILVTKK